MDNRPAALPHCRSLSRPTLSDDQRVASRTRLLLDKQPDCEWSAEPQEGTAAIAVVELDSLKGAGGSLSDPLAVPSVPVRG